MQVNASYLDSARHIVDHAMPRAYGDAIVRSRHFFGRPGCRIGPRAARGTSDRGMGAEIRYTAWHAMNHARVVVILCHERGRKNQSDRVFHASPLMYG